MKMAGKKISNSPAGHPFRLMSEKKPKYRTKRTLAFIAYWFWPLIIVLLLYIVRFINPGLFANNEAGAIHRGYAPANPPVDYYRNKVHYTIRAEEKSENRNAALIRSVVALNGEWPRDSMIDLLGELEARYRRRTDFFNFTSPTHILIYLVNESLETGDEREHFIARLSTYKDSPGQIEWNVSQTGRLDSGVREERSALSEAEGALRILGDASPEISILTGEENPRALQISIRDYAYSGDPREYIARTAQAVSKIIRGMNRPCEGVFIALFKGNYYISAESCLTAGILPDDEDSRDYASAMIWKNTDKFEFFQ